MSVVVSSHNRKEQTYFSLKSWNNIAILNNIYIHLIIVEDTVNIIDKINPEKLFYSNLYITYIYIKNKIWDNPCLNYNIGLHQWYQTETHACSNYMLYNFKTNYILKTGKYLYLKDFETF